MSRKIEYRVWDNKSKSYDDPYSYAYYALTQDGGLDFYCHGDHMSEADPDVYFVEQYTGLKDENGKEIYEGDIVEEDIDFNSKMTDGTFRYRVYWDEDLLCWSLDPIGEESIHNELWQTNLSRRVIGNIHENSEILGDTNVTNKEEEK